jgi:cytochrome c oxidase subunit 2
MSTLALMLAAKAQLAWWLAVSAIAASAAHADERGRELFRPCAACHGPTAAGNREVEAPALAGLPAWYVAKQLRDFRQGRRGTDTATDPYGAQMARMAEQLWDDGEVVSVAAYVASLPAPEYARTVRGKAKRGEATFVGCAECHGTDAAGNEQLGAPPLRALDDWYLVKQLDAFFTGVRGSHADDVAGRAMRAAAESLADPSLLPDVAVYVASLREAAARESREVTE